MQKTEAGPQGVVPTAEQQAVIDAQDGTVLVLAAVGSGKTTTLSHRIARALSSSPPVAPDRVLAVTFTNRAASHLTASLARVVGEAVAAKVVVSTFHGLCARILRSDPLGAGLPADFRILDEDDAVEVLGELGVDAPSRTIHALHSAASAVGLGRCTVSDWHEGRIGQLDWGRRYADALRIRGAVDFAGLVFLTRALLTEGEEARGRWSTAFDMVLVDEVQDTHLSEYEVLRVLAAQARSLCLVGDLDQTIYSWRGSAPRALLHRLDDDYGPIRRLHMTQNFRSTQHMLATADALASAMPDRESAVRPARGLTEGEVPTVTSFSSSLTEAEGVALQVADYLHRGVPPTRMAVLVRTHKEISRLAHAMQHHAVPHTTLEQFRFYRRAEVKDALAVARLVHDSHDEVAARRVARRMVRGVGPRTLGRIVAEGRGVGLALTDLLDADAVHHGDPMWVLERPDCIVLDTETTGFDPDEDEVIEVAAVRLRAGRFSGKPEDRFEALLQNTVPVGASEAIHHISDAQLAREGRPARQVLRELAAFIGTRPIAGHNVRFDVRMLQGHARRLGVKLPLTVRFDTLPFARRLVRDSRDHKLGTLVEHLGIQFVPTHRALDDVLATVDLARVLSERARRGHTRRWALLRKEAPAFAKLRAALSRWARAGHRPAELLRIIARDVLRYSGPDAPRRQANLAELARRVAEMDRPEVPPDRALEAVLERAALVRDVDALDGTAGVRVLTMHQSKGLEFDHVWVPGLRDGGVPSWFTVRDLREKNDPRGVDEERRLLYVAITRARRSLHLSWHRQDDRRRSQEVSRFVPELRDTVRHIAGP